jgi:hypothetical protein
MTEYDKLKQKQQEQLGSIDSVHPMKQVAIMSVVQVLMLAGVVFTMFFIGLNF